LSRLSIHVGGRRPPATRNSLRGPLPLGDLCDRLFSAPSASPARQIAIPSITACDDLICFCHVYAMNSSNLE